MFKRRPMHYFVVLIGAVWYQNGVAQNRSQSPQNIFPSARNAIVQVLVPGSSGTGFFVSSDGIVVTAAHIVIISSMRNGQPIVGYNSDIRVKLPDGRVLSAEPALPISEDSVAHDYAILKTGENRTSCLRVGSWTDVKEGDVVTTLGYALGAPSPLLISGMVSGRYAIPSPLPGRHENAIVF